MNRSKLKQPSGLLKLAIQLALFVKLLVNLVHFMTFHKVKHIFVINT